MIYAICLTKQDLAKPYITRFCFNPQNDLCVPFAYGGCEGNANNFETFDACFNKCGGGPDPGEASICNLPVDKGPCEAIIPRYAFMTETEKCEKFEYGGCEGNANNFLTLEDCNRVCEEED
ncbi:BPTI/Kunitz domain-containing protein [Armadillidium vulgare]|nr:BPTI/Kunitz domain-containing protein [Armadillidium vulgare]